MSRPDAHPAAAPPRSGLVTLVAWLVMVGSGLLLPISGITLLMVIAGSYGTRPFDPAGFLAVVVAPPVAFVSGIGLLLRWRWARLSLLTLAAVVFATASVKLLRGPTPQREHVTPSGVKVTTMATSPAGSIPPALVSLGIIVVLMLPRVRAEFGLRPRPPALPRSATAPRPPPGAPEPPTRPGWRVGHRGRDCMYYEEWTGRGWERLDISGEMLTGPAHHVIYFASPADWQRYPEWARHRRDEIIARIKSEFRPPDYEYHGDIPTPPA